MHEFSQGHIHCDITFGMVATRQGESLRPQTCGFVEERKAIAIHVAFARLV